MNDKQIKKLQTFLQALDSGAPTKEDFSNFLDLFQEAFSKLKQDLENRVSMSEKEVSDFKSSIKSMEESINSISLHLESMHKADMKEMMDKCEKDISAMKSEMDSMMGIMDEKMSVGMQGVESKIPLMSEIPEVKPQEIRDKLEVLQGEDRLDISAIKGLDEEIKRVETLISSKGSSGGGFRANHSTMFYDLSSQTNDVLKVFTVPKNVFGIVIGSDFPTVLMEGNGFTINATRTQITLTTANAPSTGSQLVFQYTSLFNIL